MSETRTTTIGDGVVMEIDLDPGLEETRKYFCQHDPDTCKCPPDVRKAAEAAAIMLTAGEICKGEAT